MEWVVVELSERGVPFLTAYAMALHISRAQFIDALRSAPGSIGECWVEVLEDYEIEELTKVTGTKRKSEEVDGASTEHI